MQFVSLIGGGAAWWGTRPLKTGEVHSLLGVIVLALLVIALLVWAHFRQKNKK